MYPDDMLSIYLSMYYYYYCVRQQLLLTSSLPRVSLLVCYKMCGNLTTSGGCWRVCSGDRGWPLHSFFFFAECNNKQQHNSQSAVMQQSVYSVAVVGSTTAVVTLHTVCNDINYSYEYELRVLLQFCCLLYIYDQV